MSGVPPALPSTTAAARLAAATDIPALVVLYEDAVQELVVLRGGMVLIGLSPRRPPYEGSFAAQLAGGSQILVAGTLGGPGHGPQSALPRAPEVVGLGSCRILTLNGGEALGCIDDLYVAPEWRRHGVGRAMSELLVRWCAEQGCTGVDAQALPGSRAVKSFFESGKFTARTLVMHHRLTPGPMR